MGRAPAARAKKDRADGAIFECLLNPGDELLTSRNGKDVEEEPRAEFKFERIGNFSDKRLILAVMAQKNDIVGRVRSFLLRDDLKPVWRHAVSL
jgi:hypothetical protein